MAAAPPAPPLLLAPVPLLLLLLAASLLSTAAAWEARPIALVTPVPGTSHLQVAQDGLAFLQALDKPVAPVVVIGPYRSGKSFLLNQLLALPCSTGFGVGHTRETETKGIWVWGEPRTVSDASGERMLLYVDTEGFESTGRSNSYDDRVFAVATVLSSLLVYNLPETVRGSDVSKLSFVVELAAGFYDRGNTSEVAVPVEPGSMLWVIQRDFLQGKSVQQLVRDALAPVPNPQQDKAIAETNAIRASLASIARNSTGYSLPQPHLDRTKLCDLDDSQLEPRYVSQRDGLRSLVRAQAVAKVVGGRALSGARLAGLLQSLVKALNAKQIPTSASLIESFNHEMVSKALEAYIAKLDAAVQLPVEAAALARAHATAQQAAEALLQEQLLGRRQAGALGQQLAAQIAKERKAKETANIAESNAVCQALEMACSKQLAARVQVPSMYQFEGGHNECMRHFEAKCVGPARDGSRERLQLAWSQARKQFSRDYNDRLFTGLLLAGVACIVLFRFLIIVPALEALGWVAVVFLEVYPHVWGGGGHMYDTKWWRATTQGWEWVMWLALTSGGLALWLCAGAAGVLCWQRLRRRRVRKTAVLASKAGDLRDLDV